MMERQKVVEVKRNPFGRRPLKQVKVNQRGMARGTRGSAKTLEIGGGKVVPVGFGMPV